MLFKIVDAMAGGRDYTILEGPDGTNLGVKMNEYTEETGKPAEYPAFAEWLSEEIGFRKPKIVETHLGV